MYLLSGAGLRWNENASAAGAQTERRGEASAGDRVSTSPAVMVLTLKSSIRRHGPMMPMVLFEMDKNSRL